MWPCVLWPLNVNMPTSLYFDLINYRTSLLPSAEPMKPAFVKPITDTCLVVGQPLALEAQIMGFPSPEIKWYKDGVQLRPSKAFNFINQPCGLIGLK